MQIACRRGLVPVATFIYWHKNFFSTSSWHLALPFHIVNGIWKTRNHACIHELTQFIWIFLQCLEPQHKKTGTFAPQLWIKKYRKRKYSRTSIPWTRITQTPGKLKLSPISLDFTPTFSHIYSVNSNSDNSNSLLIQTKQVSFLWIRISLKFTSKTWIVTIYVQFKCTCNVLFTGIMAYLQCIPMMQKLSHDTTYLYRDQKLLMEVLW